MEVRLSENSQFTADEIAAMLKETGIIELNQKELN
jgi:hypothetical protein